MQAVRWHARGDVRVEAVPPPPPPGPGEVIRCPSLGALGLHADGGLALLRDEPAKHVKILVQPEEPA